VFVEFVLCWKIDCKDNSGRDDTKLKMCKKRHSLNRILILLMMSFWLSSCSSKFIVRSDPPQADVSIIDSRSGEKKVIGKTPLEMSMSDLAYVATDPAGFMTVEVATKGFITEKFFLPKSKFGTLVSELEVKMKPGDDPKQFQMAKQVLDSLFLSQKYANSGQYPRALEEVDRVLDVFPEFARGLSLKASILFLMKKFDESTDFYQRAIKIDPQQEDSIKMLAKIEEVRGTGRGPAGTSVDQKVKK
jgi:hypothetical protein